MSCSEKMDKDGQVKPKNCDDWLTGSVFRIEIFGCNNVNNNNGTKTMHMYCIHCREGNCGENKIQETENNNEWEKRQRSVSS